MANKSFYSLFVDIRASIEGLSKDLDKAISLVQNYGKKTIGVAEGIKLEFGKKIAEGFLETGKSLAEIVPHLAELGEKAGSIAEQFDQLGGSRGSIQKARDALRGAVSDFDLMRAANEGLIKGIPQLNERFAQMADFAGRFANATGRDTVEVLNELTGAMGNATKKGAREFGIAISDTGTKVQRQNEFFKQMVDQMDRLLPVQNNVATSMKNFSTAMGDAAKEIGIGLNESPEFTVMMTDLAAAVRSVDWKKFGKELGDALGALKPVGEIVADAIRALGQLETYLNAANAGFEDLNVKKLELLKSAQGTPLDPNKSWWSMITGGERPDEKAAREGLDQNLAAAKARLDRYNWNQMAGLLGLSTSPSTGGGELSKSPVKPWSMPDPSIAEAAKKAADELQKLRDQATKDIASHEIEGIKNDLQAAIESVQKGGVFDSSSFTSMKNQLAQSVEEAFLEGHKDFLNNPGVTDGEKQRLLEVGHDTATQVANEWQDKLTKAQEAAYKESIDTWRSLFENAITGVTFDLKDALKQVAVGFAAQMAQSLLGSLTGFNIKNPQDIGGAIAQSILGEIKGSVASEVTGGGGGILETLGLSNLLGGGASGGGGAFPVGTAADGGTMMSDGSVAASGSSMMAGLPALAAIVGVYQANRSFNAVQNGNPRVAGIAGFVAGGLGIAGLAAGAASLWGKHEDPDTKARKQIEDFLRGKLGSSLGGTNFGSGSKFKPGGMGFDAFSKLDQKGKETFSGLGDAITAVLGVTQDVGPQIAAILAEDLGGSADKARQAFRKLGLSLPDLEQKLLEVGKQGKKTWLEIVSDIHGVEEAAKPGLAAVGDVAGALDALKQSGAKGDNALFGVRDIFVEAADAGIKSFDELSKKFGNLPGLDKVIQSAQDLHLSFEDMTKLTDRQGAEMVAHLQAIGFEFSKIGEQIDSVTASWDLLNQTADQTPDVVGKKLTNSDVPAFAKGGIVHGPTYGLMGEAGPEAILPLTRVNGKLGVMTSGSGASGMHIHIDARGAGPGVEHSIRAAMNEMEERTVRRVFSSIAHERDRAR